MQRIVLSRTVPPTAVNPCLIAWRLAIALREQQANLELKLF